MTRNGQKPISQDSTRETRQQINGLPSLLELHR